MTHFESDDWKGLGASLAAHALFILVFALLTAGRPEPQRLGFVQVNIGPFARGRPVQQAEAEQPEAEVPTPTPEETAPQQPEEPPEPTTQPQQEQPAPESKPVDLPDQQEPVQNEEQTEVPETETVAPRQPPAAEAEEAQEMQPEQQTAAVGGGQASGETGAASGEEGDGADPQESAPYDIEGLNREAVYAPLPRFVDKQNVDLSFQITVNPSGRVVGARPVLKGNPALEQEVRRVLQQWRFNPLPAGAPQANQTGRITFRFRVE